MYIAYYSTFFFFSVRYQNNMMMMWYQHTVQYYCPWRTQSHYLQTSYKWYATKHNGRTNNNNLNYKSMQLTHWTWWPSELQLYFQFIFLQMIMCILYTERRERVSTRPTFNLDIKYNKTRTSWSSSSRYRCIIIETVLSWPKRCFFLGLVGFPHNHLQPTTTYCPLGQNASKIGDEE